MDAVLRDEPLYVSATPTTAIKTCEDPSEIVNLEVEGVVLGKDIKIGDFIMIKGHPCKIHHLTFSHGGKHGIRKIIIEGKYAFTDQKYATIISVVDNVQLLIPEHTKKVTCIDYNS